MTSSFEFYSQSRLSSLTIIEDQMNELRMIKICDEALVKPLSLIYKNCIDTGVFPDIWKKSNIAPVYKSGEKQIIDNY